LMSRQVPKNCFLKELGHRNFRAIFSVIVFMGHRKCWGMLFKAIHLKSFQEKCFLFGYHGCVELDFFVES
jgi:hypothetical protein